MKDWIQKNIDPPGIEKKNRGSLFSFIARVFDIVRKDAIKAFNAFFPYLADSEKLREHGEALSIPEFPFDSEEEYRERVSAASFFLMKAGERGYILDQLHGRFGDHFVFKEDFLKVYFNIAELREDDRIWLHSLLDGLLDPNIQLTVSEWFHFIDTMPMSDELKLKVRRRDVDSFAGDFICNGQFYCDQGKELLCDGTWECDGTHKCNHYISVIGSISDYIIDEINADGRRFCDGSWDCTGIEDLYSPIEITKPISLKNGLIESSNTLITMKPFEDHMKVDFICDGSFLCNGSNTDSIVDGPMTLRIYRLLRCDGTKTPWAKVCDGSIICDGTYSDFDGPYYSGDVLLEEEVIL